MPAWTSWTTVRVDALPSTFRSGVASGVSTLTWLTFMPLAFTFGLVTRNTNPQTAGWLILLTTTAGTALLALATRRHRCATS